MRLRPFFVFLFGLASVACSSNQEKTQELFTNEDNYYDYNYYKEPVDDPLTDFSVPYTRPAYQEPEVYYDEIQMMQDFSGEKDEPENAPEEVKEVERKGPRGFLYDGSPPPKSSEWFFEDY